MAVVQLDVSPAGPVSAQIATGRITVGQLDLENVVPARLSLVADMHPRGARLAVNGHVVVNEAASRVTGISRIARDRSLLDVHATAVINVVEVPPERPVADTPGDTEVGLGPGRRASDPAAARDEVAGRLRRRAAHELAIHS